MNTWIKHKEFTEFYEIADIYIRRTCIYIENTGQDSDRYKK